MLLLLNELEYLKVTNYSCPSDHVVMHNMLNQHDRLLTDYLVFSELLHKRQIFAINKNLIRPNVLATGLDISLTRH